MSRLKQPVFEKPDEPDFIKRIKGVHQAEVQALERPMTEAPILEDELPTIANDVDKEDIDQFRKSQGVQESREVQKATSETVESKLMRKSVKKDPQAGLAGLKTAAKQNQKRLRLLQDFKAKEDVSDALEIVETQKRKVKDSSKPRKKMKVSLLDDAT